MYLFYMLFILLLCFTDYSFIGYWTDIVILVILGTYTFAHWKYLKDKNRLRDFKQKFLLVFMTLLMVSYISIFPGLTMSSQALMNQEIRLDTTGTEYVMRYRKVNDSLAQYYMVHVVGWLPICEKYIGNGLYFIRESDTTATLITKRSKRNFREAIRAEMRKKMRL